MARFDPHTRRIPLRLAQGRARAQVQPELTADPELHTDGVPWVYAELLAPAHRPMAFVLRLHNTAGIPVIDGRGEVAAGETRVAFRALRALGIEAYAHAREEQRLEVARRVWSRCAYGTIEPL
ncbi:MAG TPA: hypothetical protein PKD53_02510 [Chloroflexaceae bacterium]|nr:hypothetical protein [Chloroflexaceae bacterium]